MVGDACSYHRSLFKVSEELLVVQNSQRCRTFWGAEPLVCRSATSPGLESQGLLRGWQGALKPEEMPAHSCLLQARGW